MRILTVFFLIMAFSCNNSKDTVILTYPKINKEVKIDHYHNTSIEDPYRNIENLKDSTILKWFEAQGKLSDSLLKQITNHEKIFDGIVDIEKKGNKIVDNFYISKEHSYFFLKRDEDNALISKLYYKESIHAIEKLILDPKEYKKNYIINYYKVSHDLSKIAISLAKKGEDSSEIIVYDLHQEKLLSQKITKVSPDLVGGINWLPDNSGFTYLHIPHFEYDSPSYLLNTKAFVYKLGTDPSQAIEIFSKDRNTNLKLQEADFPIIQTREENPNILIGRISGNTAFKDVYYVNNYDTSFGNENLNWNPLFKQEHKIDEYTLVNDSIIYRTAKDASNYKICKTSLENPNYDDPEVLVSEINDRVIVDFEYLDGTVYYTTLKNGVKANFYSLSSKGKKEIELPYPSGVSYINKKGNDLYISIGGWTRPYSLFRYAPINGTFDSVELNTTNYPEFENFVVEEIEIPSHDGSLVPLSLIYKPDLVKDSTNRVLIMAYGAYGSSMSPFFVLPTVYWIEQGGILAIAHVRGGGEKGDAWHKAGRKETKPNTWKDLIACSEYIIDNEYSSPDKMIVYGVSAGGIAAGRAITERPDLYAVGLLEAPFLNTLRIDDQPFGGDSVKEFGSTKDSLEFRALLKMDAYHTIKDTIQYPALYVSTSMNDGLVTPWDPGKFVAKMQNISNTKKPILFSVDFNATHGGDGTTHKAYKNMANMFTYALWQTGHPDYQ